MVHQTMSSNATKAPNASSKISPMNVTLLRRALLALIVGTLAACATRAPPERPPAAQPPTQVAPLPGEPADLPAPRMQPRSHWVPVHWGELPGFADDALHEAWNAWIKSCERPAAPFAALCSEVRQLSIATADDQRAWLVARLQPYRVEAQGGGAEGLLTGYFEPEYDAARQPGNGYGVPLYAPPSDLARRRPWFTRQEIDTAPEAQAVLAGRAIAWLRDPVDAMVLHIQGSGRLNVIEPDGTRRLVRVAYAGTNDRPYRSIGRWLLDQGLVRDATWPGIRAWMAQNPQRVNELLWSNPRYVFFREEPMDALDAAFGPRGAQGVPLTPGRSIAVDKASIPYGTPVWLASPGPLVPLQRLVLAQDTGSAIVGAVRADFFLGWGADAGEMAGRLKQPLRLWVLWPR
ncbi:MAG: murein transglycosylase A [Giesbergeria sp.]